MSRVFLIMSSDTAAVAYEVIQARIDELRRGECRAPAVRAVMDDERKHLETVAGQLKEPE